MSAEEWLGMMGYEKDIEDKMQRLFATLSEKDRRRYAGIEAEKLGQGGIEYVSGLGTIGLSLNNPEFGRLVITIS